jgi:hypothetical protein
MTELGKLVKVDLREVWPDESGSFTPWMAEEKNIKELGDTIGIELEVESQEKEVGPFRADILCKDTTNDQWVLIENQLERTDHTHLGQLMTYAAGLEAVTIIWIAQTFSDEHRAALDWLNEITEEGINFFGLEIELYRIGDSPIAPKFNIVCKPNEWSRTVKTSATSGELTDTKKLQLDYWITFRNFMEETKSFVRCQKPLPQHWTCFAIGRSHFHLSATVNTRDKKIAAYLCISGPDKKAHFLLLKSKYKQKIESVVGHELDWREIPEAKESHIGIYLDADPTNKTDWSRQHKWLKDNLEKLHEVLSPIIEKLDAADYHEEL